MKMPRLVVYDPLVREVAVLVHERKSPGICIVTFDGSRLAAGVSVDGLTAGNVVQTRKMILVKQRITRGGWEEQAGIRLLIGAHAAVSRNR